MRKKTKHKNLPFLKMHGLGNDFVVIDSRNGRDRMTPEMARAIGNRHTGVGFDQLAVITKGDADIHLTFYNSDGSTAAACGNATRCIARYIMEDTGKSDLHITTERGDLFALDAGNGMTSVNMGHPLLKWDEIPLSRKMDTLKLDLKGEPTATGMGNPHCTFFVENAEEISLENFGPFYENHCLFPERTNVQVAHIIEENQIRMRVWERGVGITLASGSSSCATAVAAARRGLTDRSVTIELDGGTIYIDWRDDGVWLKGPTQHVFSGTFTTDFLSSL